MSTIIYNFLYIAHYQMKNLIIKLLKNIKNFIIKLLKNIIPICLSVIVSLSIVYPIIRLFYADFVYTRSKTIAKVYYIEQLKKFNNNPNYKDDNFRNSNEKNIFLYNNHSIRRYRDLQKLSLIPSRAYCFRLSKLFYWDINKLVQNQQLYKEMLKVYEKTKYERN